VIIDIDVGNTRVKWRLSDEKGVVLKRGFISTSAVISLASLNVLFAEEVFSGLQHVRIAAVVSSHNDAFGAWAKQYDIEPFFASVSAHCAGVTNAYTTVTQMGVDRWLATIAAFHQVKGACIVVDAGSALTIDVVQADGKHAGGYIVPGLEMMYRSLLGDTEQVKLPQVMSHEYPLDLIPGANTQQAVLSGLPLMLLGLVSNTLSTNEGICASSVIFVTGGNGDYISTLLQHHDIRNIMHDPELVLDGLSLAFNE
jgi:type III pantothenate kinase